MKTQGQINEMSTNIAEMAQQLNKFKPVNHGYLGNLKGEVTTDVSVKLSQTEQKVAELSAEMTRQSEAAK